MKKGYSVLLGEYIDAPSIDYLDCKGFQVVCPCCREPVFKVLRNGGSDLHYLAHYAASKAFSDDCELRVASLKSADAERHNHESREQRLKYFMAVMRDAVTAAFYTSGESKVSALQRLMNRSKPISWLRETSYEYARKASVAFIADFELFAGTYIDEGIGTDDPVWKTGFAMQVQVRIARDMMATLLSAAGRSNYEWLWNHAYMFLETRLEGGRKAGIQTPPVAAIQRNLSRLHQCNRNDGMQLIAEMAQAKMYPPEVSEPGFPMLGKVFAEIQHEMVGSLIRLPYFELLKAREFAA